MKAAVRMLRGFAAGICLAAAADSAWQGLPEDHAAHPVPPLARPALHEPYRDPVFGSLVMRVTDPSQVPGAKWVRHYYAKSEPFNADGSLAVLFDSMGEATLYETATWNPLKKLALHNSDPEIQWHPRDPDVFYYLDLAGRSTKVRALYRYDVRDDSRILLHDFAEYDTVSSRFEGNMDRAGRYYAMVGRKGSSLEALVYDLATDRVTARLPVAEATVGDWISVSPSGRYVVAMGRRRSRIYDIRLNHLRDLPAGSFGHGDLCTLEDGSEALVYDGADRRLWWGRHINIANLDSGEEIATIRLGWRTTPHISCRNLDLPGWALVSTQGPDRRYPNHDFEIFWLRLDGSGEVRRVAHHHSDRASGGYFAEQHAVASRDGRRIMFASNWGDGPIADYVVSDAVPEAVPWTPPTAGMARR